MKKFIKNIGKRIKKIGKQIGKPFKKLMKKFYGQNKNVFCPAGGSKNN